MRIDPSGNVGINTTSPSFTLDVSGTARITTSLTTANVYSTNQTTTNIVGTNISSGQLQVNYNTGRAIQVGTGFSSHGNISITGNGPALYHLYNGGAVIEWAFGQKTITNNSFSISTVFSQTITDRMVLTPSGELSVSSSVSTGSIYSTNITSTNITSTNIVGTNISASNININKMTNTNYQLNGTIDGGIFTINTAANGVILQSSSTLANYTVMFPTSIVNGQQIFISTDKTITNISYGNTTIPPNTLIAYAAQRFIYIGDISTWFSY